MRLNSAAMTPNANSWRYDWGQVPKQQRWRKENSQRGTRDSSNFIVTVRKALVFHSSEQAFSLYNYLKHMALQLPVDGRPVV